MPRYGGILMSKKNSRKLLYVVGKKETIAIDLSRKDWFEPLMCAINAVGDKNGLVRFK
jgi:hypothetical protein